jgi:hypothetical protein
MADPGTFEYWQSGEQPPAPPLHLSTGGFEYWQSGEQPPVLDDQPLVTGGATPDRGWGWGWQGLG